MKLANEIAEEIYHEQKEIRDKFGVELGVETIKGLIASRLEPLREMLAKAHASESTLDMWDDIGKALALLSEGE